MSGLSIVSEDMEDQISEYCHKPVVNDSVQSQEVLDDMKCEIRELAKSIAVVSKDDVSKISLNPDNTIIPTERNVLLKRKTQIVNTLRVEMEMDKSMDIPRSASDCLNTYLNEITKDVQKIDECLSIETRREGNMAMKEERLRRYEESFERLEEGLENCQETALPEMEMRITQDFKMIKAELAEFLGLFSPDGKLREILEELMSISEAEGDKKYLDITEDNLPYMSLLLQANVILKHPIRPSKFCFANFE